MSRLGREKTSSEDLGRVAWRGRLRETRRWRELDSNLRFRARAGSILPVRFVADSLLEQAGFEPSVPRDTIWVSREAHVTSARFHPDRKFGDQKPVGRDPA